ncbi:MAG: alginate export family protein [Bacteroidota bacterium]
MMRYLITRIFFFLLICQSVAAQTDEQHNSEAPLILTTRAEEDYSSLNNNDSTDFFLKEVKYIPLSSSQDTYLTLGGGYRARLDHTRNGNFGTEDETSYLQRLDFHAALNFNNRVKLFTEFYHGFSSAGEVTLQSDDIDLHQAFIDWKVLDGEDRMIKLRLGRQEIGYGASRLVGIRNGPNIRRSFDMGQVRMQFQKTKIDVFYGAEVGVSANPFDNASTLFNSNTSNPELWGVYLNTSLHENLRSLDLYYLGFHSDLSAFNDVSAEETRHSFGLRSYGSLGRFTYNTELIFQSGKLGNSDVFAYNFETDWKYLLVNRRWKLQIGLKLDWSSGDRETGDNRIGTFNPIFVNPGIYSLASVNTPANMFSFHPNVGIRPSKNLYVYFDYAFFFRTQTSDGFYRPPRFLSRPATASSDTFLGETFGLLINYEFNRNISLDLVTYYFLTGSFIDDSGSSENIFFIAPTASLKF